MYCIEYFIGNVFHHIMMIHELINLTSTFPFFCTRTHTHHVCTLYIVFNDCINNRILIDDRIALKKNWVDAGGIFIHHINTETTIKKLSNLGIISREELPDNKEKDWYWDVGGVGEAGTWKHWR
jgi:hypothetical protein